MTKLDRLARSLPDARAIVDELTARQVRRFRTREGIKIAKAKGHLRGRKPKLSVRQEAHLVHLLAANEHSTAGLAKLFGVGRSTVYRALDRSKATAPGT